MDLFSGLNLQQKAAVEKVDGRLLILAGAGSGKTRVLTLRMAHLVKNYSIPPQSILGLTFTNKAAVEMRRRVSFILGAEALQISLCTFHGFCMQVLRNEIHRLGYTPQFTLYDEKDVQRLVTLIARDLLEREGNLPSLQSTTDAITIARNKGLKSEQIVDTGSEWHDQFTRTLYQRLQDSMRAYNAVDFDSLLGLTVELFESCPDVLERYQDRFRYIMIDEYQDTNPIQYRLASMISAKYNNLCVVGDDDQSIYGWRGADVQNILDFSDATLIKLEQNYRSTHTILKAANAVIQNNKKRHEKVLWSDKGDGRTIEVFTAPNEINEAEAVVYRINQLRENEGLCWGNIAILYRSNALSRNFETALMKYSWKDKDEHWVQGIPYQVHGGVEFYERREIKDLFSYLRVIVNPFDQAALLRIINYPRRGIGEASLDLLTAHNRSKKIPLWDVINHVVCGSSGYEELCEKIAPKALNGLKEFLDIMATAKAKFGVPPFSETMTWLVDRISYQKAINEEVKSDQMRDFKWENVQEFISAIADYDQKRGGDPEIPYTLHDYVVSSPLDKNWEGASGDTGKENKVTLMTFHSAKGLEFPACFLVGMEDHIIPHEKSLKQTGIEEERRLMYVAITRAMKFLTISMAQQRKRMGVDSHSRPSRFLFEIPKEHLKATKWSDGS
ncbi:MAG: UvrD-helicase domain-containing protein [Parachlamydiaceae bacterium]|nr:UvrD-helicase domain-containing protein [Parachlamydiaceae bacterium]